MHAGRQAVLCRQSAGMQDCRDSDRTACSMHACRYGEAHAGDRGEGREGEYVVDWRSLVSNQPGFSP